MEQLWKYDLGYWKIEGKWNSASNITLNKSGILYFDNVFVNGVNKIKVNPTTATTSLRAEYSIDGGGHWLLINNNGMANTSNEIYTK